MADVIGGAMMAIGGGLLAASGLLPFARGPIASARELLGETGAALPDPPSDMTELLGRLD